MALPDCVLWIDKQPKRVILTPVARQILLDLKASGLKEGFTN